MYPNHLTAFQLGKMAWVVGEPQSANPYLEIESARMWRAGWLAANRAKCANMKRMCSPLPLCPADAPEEVQAARKEEVRKSLKEQLRAVDWTPKWWRR